MLQTDSRPAVRSQGARSRPERCLCNDQYDRIIEALDRPEKAARRALALVPQWSEAADAPPFLQHHRGRDREENPKIAAVAAVSWVTTDEFETKLHGRSCCRYRLQVASG